MFKSPHMKTFSFEKLIAWQKARELASEIYKITKPIQQFDISLNRDFLNKKLKIGIHAFDIFNQNEVNALVSSTNLQTNFYEKNDSRTFRISLTYKFGNLKLEKENTDIQTEKVQSGGGMMK